MTKLSPAAEAVLAAVRRFCVCPSAPEIAAAVLLELADQAGSAKHWHVNEIRTIADELEGRG